MSNYPFPTSGLTRLDFYGETSKLTKISIMKKSMKKVVCLYILYSFTVTLKYVKVYRSIQWQSFVEWLPKLIDFLKGNLQKPATNLYKIDNFLTL